MYGGGIQLGTEHGQGQNITHLFEPGTPVLVPEFCGAYNGQILSYRVQPGNIVSRPFGIGDLKENWFLLFSN